MFPKSRADLAITVVDEATSPKPRYKAPPCNAMIMEAPPPLAGRACNPVCYEAEPRYKWAAAKATRGLVHYLAVKP